MTEYLDQLFFVSVGLVTLTFVVLSAQWYAQLRRDGSRAIRFHQDHPRGRVLPLQPPVSETGDDLRRRDLGGAVDPTFRRHVH